MRIQSYTSIGVVILSVYLVVMGYSTFQTDCYGNVCLVSQPLLGLVAIGLLLLIGVFLFAKPFYSQRRESTSEKAPEEPPDQAAGEAEDTEQEPADNARITD